MLIWILMFVSMATGFWIGVGYAMFRRGTTAFWYREFLREHGDVQILKRQLHEAKQVHYDAMYRVPPTPDRTLEDPG